MKHFTFLTAAALLAAPAAFAKGPTGMLAGYLTNSKLDFEGVGDDDGTGFGLKGWTMLNGPIFAHAEYQAAELDFPAPFGTGDLESLRLGGGYYHMMAQDAGLIGKVEYVDLGSDVDQDGFGVHGGVLFQAMPALALFGTLGYLSTSDTDGLEFNLGAGYSFTKEWGAFVDYRAYLGAVDVPGDPDFEINDLRAGVTYSFGG